MKKPDDEQFNEMKASEKYKEIFAFSTVETRAAFILTLIFFAISVALIVVNGKDRFITEILELYNNIGMALIGLLGFSVAGLAILIGVISSKMAHFFKENDVLTNVEDILRSFYFVGFLMAIEIMLIFISYSFSKIEIASIVVVDVIVTMVLTYLFSFILFYSVGLIGNCISMFSLIINVEDGLNRKNENLKEIYDSYRIVALEYVILVSSDKDKYVKYDEKINELIQKDVRTSAEQKKELFNIQKKHFNK